MTSKEQEAVYEGLTRWNPKLIANLQFCVNEGFSKTAIIAKTKEFIPAGITVPPFVWEYIEIALDYMVEQRQRIIEMSQRN